MGKTTSHTPHKIEPTPAEQQILRSAMARSPLETLRYLTRSSLFRFIQYFWDTYSQTPFVANWHIEQICGEVEVVIHRVGRREQKIYDLAINVPPGSTKTAMVSIMAPVWGWVNYPWMRYITSSHSRDLSNESAEYSRSVIRSDKFQQLFPEIGIQEDKDVKSNFRVVQKRWVRPGYAPRLSPGGSRVSTSVDARIMGFHGDLIIPDDLIDPRRAVSEVGLNTANDHLATLYTRKTDKRTSTVILIMQRLHQDDPTGYLITHLSNGVRHICLPGELANGYDKFVKPPEWKEYYVDGLLDPIRLGHKELEELEAILGQYGYSGQVGQNPTPPEGGMFKPERMAIVERLSSETNLVATVRYWDKAGTQDGGKRTAGVKMSKLSNGKYVIWDVTKGHWSTENREAVIKSTSEADAAERPTRIGIEQEGGSGGKESAESTIMNLAGLSVHADRPTGDKAWRADPFSVQVNNGNVILIKGDWNQDFKDELVLFPVGTYSDQVDAASGAFNMLRGKRQARSLRKPKTSKR